MRKKPTLKKSSTKSKSEKIKKSNPIKNFPKTLKPVTPKHLNNGFDLIENMRQQENFSREAQNIMNNSDSIISFTIQNLTPFPVKDVKLFNKNYKNQKEVYYHCEQIPYEELIDRISAMDEAKQVIDIIQSSSTSASQPFRLINHTEKKIDGTTLTQPIFMVLDPYQHQSGVCKKKSLNIPFYNACNFELTILEPLIRVTYIFSIKNKKSDGVPNN